MNILLLGSGAREHALAWKLAQSDLCTNLYIAPGNVGTALCGTNVDILVTDFANLKGFCLKNAVEMVVVGPEEPLVRGIYESFTQDAATEHIAVIGPSARGAMLEGSKAFAKGFMHRHGIPTAAYRTFSKDTLAEAITYVKDIDPPIVIKADGLAAGKGVVICSSESEARNTLNEFIEANKLGEAGSKVVIEEFLSGVEFSVFVLTDGKNYKILPVAKDYKRLGEGDIGPNTGGMGAVSPVPFVTDTLMEKVITRIIEPTINGLLSEGIVYKGFIYVGLINVGGEPFVIEYNCRMGDPETEVVMPRLESDLVDILKHLHNGTLDGAQLTISSQAAVTIVAASKGYPGTYQKDKRINGIDNIEDATVFYAGVKQVDSALFTTGGRVLTVTALGKDINEARLKALDNIKKIQCEGLFYRTDIGMDLM